MGSSYRTEWWRPDLPGAETDRSEALAPAISGSAPGSVPFWGLMAFTFILLIAPQNQFPALEPLRLGLVTAALAIASYLLDRFLHWRPLSLWSREIGLAFGIAGWAILTMPFSSWVGGSVSFFLDVYVKTLAVFWLLANVVDNASRIRKIAWGLSVMAVPLTVTALNNFFTGYFYDKKTLRIAGYDAGLSENPNDLAPLLNLIVPLTVALLLSRRTPMARLSLIAVLGLEVITILATFSRGGFIVLATILLVYLWQFRRRRERKWVWAILLVMTLSVPLFGPAYVSRLATITDIESDQTGSAQSRWNDTVTAAGLVLKSPIFGAGIGNNILALNEARGDDWSLVHNVYLEHAVDLGVPALVLFLMLLKGCIRSASNVQKRSDGIPALREVFYFAEAIKVSLIAFSVAGLFYPVAYHFYFYYFAGLAVALEAVYRAEVSVRP
ncbi:MAG: O-antigen ligase family protein [Deltaproteobacteria bacterium]|nr:O-antigen ligase family protein [Deltaproteobacteria bacterium]